MSFDLKEQTVSMFAADRVWLDQESNTWLLCVTDYDQWSKHPTAKLYMLGMPGTIFIAHPFAGKIMIHMWKIMSTSSTYVEPFTCFLVDTFPSAIYSKVDLGKYESSFWHFLDSTDEMTFRLTYM